MCTLYRMINQPRKPPPSNKVDAKIASSRILYGKCTVPVLPSLACSSERLPQMFLESSSTARWENRNNVGFTSTRYVLMFCFKYHGVSARVRVNGLPNPTIHFLVTGRSNVVASYVVVSHDRSRKSCAGSFRLIVATSSTFSQLLLP